MVAAEIAATSPHRVDKLVLIAPIGLWRDDHPVPDISGIPPSVAAVARLRRSARARSSPPCPAPDPTDPESLFRASQTMASILQFIWPLPDKGLSKRLYRLTAPTLLVWGAQDGLVHPAYGEDFRELIAGSRLEVVDGAGHMPQLEQAETTIGLITDFLVSRRVSSD